MKKTKQNNKNVTLALHSLNTLSCVFGNKRGLLKEKIGNAFEIDRKFFVNRCMGNQK